MEDYSDLLTVEDFLSNFKIIKIKTVIDNGNKIQIIESKNRKVLNVNHITYSMLNKNSVYTGHFWDYFIPAAFLFEKPKVLILGYGCGTVAYQLGTLLKNKVTIDGVELSRKIARLARSFVPKAYGKVIISDAFDYVIKTKKKYDLIIFDVYADSQIPERFTRIDFVDNAHRVLSLDGLMLINYMMSPRNWLRYGTFKKMLRRRFHLYVVKTSGLGDSIMLICSKKLEGKEIYEHIKKKMKKSEENALILKRYSEIKEI